MRVLLLLLMLVWTARSAGVPPPNTYDSEAQIWRQSILTNSSTLSATAYRAGTVFMQQSKWWGIRPSLGRVNLYVGNDLAAWSIPIIRDFFTTQNQPDSAVNFVAGDYSEATGLTGNTSTKYVKLNGAAGLELATSVVPSTTPTNLHYALYIRSASTESTFAMGIQANLSTPIFYMIVSYSATKSLASEMGDTANASWDNTDPNQVGFYMAQRLSPTYLALYKNGSSVLTNSTSDTAAIPTGINLYVHCLSQGNNPVLFNSRTFAYYSVGYGIQPDRTAAYYTLVQNFQTAMGRQK